MHIATRRALPLAALLGATLVSAAHAQPSAPEPTPAPAPAPAPAPEPIDPALLTTVLDGVQGFYSQAVDFKSDFKQTFTYKIYQRKKVSTGEVFFKKPALMRWDYEAPSRRLFIADGATLWVYEPEEAQVFKRDLASAQLPVALRFMKGEGKLSDDFVVGALKEEGDSYRLHLTPKVPSSEYQALQLVVNKAQYSVRASVLVDPVGNTNHIEFVTPTINTQLPDEGFKFSPPEGVRVIED